MQPFPPHFAADCLCAPESFGEALSAGQICTSCSAITPHLWRGSAGVLLEFWRLQVPHFLDTATLEDSTAHWDCTWTYGEVRDSKSHPFAWFHHGWSKNEVPWKFKGFQGYIIIFPVTIHHKLENIPGISRLDGWCPACNVLRPDYFKWWDEHGFIFMRCKNALNFPSKHQCCLVAPVSTRHVTMF